MKILNRKITISILISGIALFMIIFIVFPLVVTAYFNYYSEPYIYSNINEIPESHTALVLGARVYKNNRVSHVLYDRIISGVELYKSGKVKKILASGARRSEDYDEVNAMKYHLLKNNIDSGNILLDYAGFDTYDSIVRAKGVYDIKDVLIVTQRFHLSRAVYIARENGLNAFGYIADKRKYQAMIFYEIREMYACVKALIEVYYGAGPEYQGNRYADCRF